MLHYSAEKLSSLVSLKVSYQGSCWQVIEALGDEQTLVLQKLGEETGTIQMNQYGGGTRRVPEIVNLPIVDGQQEYFSRDFLTLDLID